jgi:glycosyltransferase involved in cell wall biosynthesis
MTRRIVVLEPDCEGEAHLPFNAGILAALAAAAPAAGIEFHAAASHRAALMPVLSPTVAARLHGGPLAGAGHHGRRRMVDPALLRRLWASPAGAGDRVVVPTATRGSFFALALATRLGRVARGTAFAVGHSLLADLWEKPRRNPLLRRVDLTHALRAFLAAGHRLVVLEAGIEMEFAARFPDLAHAVRLWPHPLPPAIPAMPAGPIPGAGNRPRIGFLGWTGGDKGFGAFLAAARDFAGAAEFHAIGHGAPGDGDPGRAGLGALATAPRAGFWPRAEYARHAAALDYVCMFYDARAYRFVASGVLMDALAFGIPVIAPDIPLLARIAAQHGEIGLLYDGAKGRDAAVAAAIALAGTWRHAAMKRNIAAAAAARGPDRLARTIAADLGFGPAAP